MNYEDLFGERLQKLREQKNVSGREMSLSIGQNDSYINRIENKKNFPSMQCFFYICEYLNISAEEFFDFDNTNPRQLQELIEDLKSLDEEQIKNIHGIVKGLKEKSKR